MAKKSTLQKYYNNQAALQVLGTLMKAPLLLTKREYNLSIEDFSMVEKHKLLFSVINNLVCQGINIITVADVETYLNTNDVIGHKLFFGDEKATEWLSDVYEDANCENFDHYYEIVRKMSLLRNYIQEGIDVKDIYNPDELDNILIKEQMEEFEAMSLDDIKININNRIKRVNRVFVSIGEGTRRKSGDNAKELLDRMRESPSYGYNTESAYLTSIIRGLRRKCFFIETRDTGMGEFLPF